MHVPGLIAGVVVAIALGSVSATQAQTAPGAPGQPDVVVLANNMVRLSFAWPQGGGPVSYFLIRAGYQCPACSDIRDMPGSPFFISRQTTVEGGPLTAGTYTVRVVAVNDWAQTESPSRTFTVAQGSAPDQPGLLEPAVSGSTVTISWQPAATGSPATMYELQATVVATGEVLTLPLGNRSPLVVQQVPPGIYSVRMRAINAFGASLWSPARSVVIGGYTLPAAPHLYQPTVDGSNVSLSWDPPATGTVQTAYEIEAVVQATGQTFTFPLDPAATRLTVPGVPAGNFLARIRARNVMGWGPWSQERLVVVGVTLTTGDLQITLTWNSSVDMDLHVIEPDGTHVYRDNRTGHSAQLDVDDTNGFGPENVYVPPGQAIDGTYQIFIVQYGARATTTTSTISVRLFPNTANEWTTIVTRATAAASSSVGYNVADVNIITGTITETTGTRTVSGPAAIAGTKPITVP